METDRTIIEKQEIVERLYDTITGNIFDILDYLEIDEYGKPIVDDWEKEARMLYEEWYAYIKIPLYGWEPVKKYYKKLGKKKRRRALEMFKPWILHIKEVQDIKHGRYVKSLYKYLRDEDFMEEITEYKNVDEKQEKPQVASYGKRKANVRE